MGFDRMPKTIRAHYDGHVIVPDEKLDLPPSLEIRVTINPDVVDARTKSERLDALDKWVSGLPGKVLPESAFDRDTLYPDCR